MFEWNGIVISEPV